MDEGEWHRGLYVPASGRGGTGSETFRRQGDEYRNREANVPAPPPAPSDVMAPGGKACNTQEGAGVESFG